MTRSWRAPLLLAAIVPFVPSACAPEEVVLFNAPARVQTGGSAGQGGNSTGGEGEGAAGSGGRISMLTGGFPGFPGGGSSGLPGTGGGGEGGFRDGLRCKTDMDCQGAWWCQKPDCFATYGQCTPLQVFCNEPPAPVCGCNGITYWSDCVRREATIAAATPGECRLEARPCSRAEDCGTEDAECAFLYPRPDRCDEPPSGTCWVLPRDCPSGDELRGDARWIECLEPGAPLPPDFPKCVDTCTAIRSVRAHVRPLRVVDCDE
ncbi:MAG: hypothetical protein M3020_12030 [Myxococcota bacterium]|nr:hypothetical protein [Myxococcota bacterium]